MPSARKHRRDCVYVIGAGFSAGLGYPLTGDLLFRLWEQLDDDLRERLSLVVKFHHSGFSEKLFTTFPNIEELLSEMLINEKLFEASREFVGEFKLSELQKLQRDLLLRISSWFHNLSEKSAETSWLQTFKKRVYEENAVIISFNWDLVLDRLLFDDELNVNSYRLHDGKAPVLLKPHGSLNWFEHDQGRYISANKRLELFNLNDKHRVYAFRHFRAPVSANERTYTPLIVPPVHLKEFSKPIFTTLWRDTVSALSTANRVVFLGYSMPANDLHVHFIMRCGFHNQTEGILGPNGRKRATGAAHVAIVNPDQAAARRIAAAVGHANRCQWVSSPVSEWITAQGHQ